MAQGRNGWAAQHNHRVIDLPGLRERVHVFRDRTHAGNVLAEMLHQYRASGALVLAIPAGGIPVAAVVARQLRLPLDVAVVSKIVLPWNTEAGYGAVAFDGTVRLNAEMVGSQRLDDEDLQRGISETRSKVIERVTALRGDRPELALEGIIPILIDDGLASGFTMQVAVEAVRKANAKRIVAAVPTGHEQSVQALGAEVETLYCANIRGGWRFAVAEAYQQWHDVGLAEAKRMLADFASTA